LHINQFVELILSLEDIGVRCFTNLTLKLLPVVAGDIFTVFLRMFLALDPAFEALKMDKTD